MEGLGRGARGRGVAAGRDRGREGVCSGRASGAGTLRTPPRRLQVALSAPESPCSLYWDSSRAGSQRLPRAPRRQPRTPGAASRSAGRSKNCEGGCQGRRLTGPGCPQSTGRVLRGGGGLGAGEGHLGPYCGFLYSPAPAKPLGGGQSALWVPSADPRALPGVAVRRAGLKEQAGARRSLFRVGSGAARCPLLVAPRGGGPRREGCWGAGRAAELSLRPGS